MNSLLKGALISIVMVGAGFAETNNHLSIKDESVFTTRPYTTTNVRGQGFEVTIEAGSRWDNYGTINFTNADPQVKFKGEGEFINHSLGFKMLDKEKASYTVESYAKLRNADGKEIVDLEDIAAEIDENLKIDLNPKLQITPDMGKTAKELGLTLQMMGLSGDDFLDEIEYVIDNLKKVIVDRVYYRIMERIDGSSKEEILGYLENISDYGMVALNEEIINELSGEGTTAEQIISYLEENLVDILDRNIEENELYQGIMRYLNEIDEPEEIEFIFNLFITSGLDNFMSRLTTYLFGFQDEAPRKALINDDSDERVAPVEDEAPEIPEEGVLGNIKFVTLQSDTEEPLDLRTGFMSNDEVVLRLQSGMEFHADQSEFDRGIVAFDGERKARTFTFNPGTEFSEVPLSVLINDAKVTYTGSETSEKPAVYYPIMEREPVPGAMPEDGLTPMDEPIIMPEPSSIGGILSQNNKLLIEGDIAIDENAEVNFNGLTSVGLPSLTDVTMNALFRVIDRPTDELK